MFHAQASGCDRLLIEDWHQGHRRLSGGIRNLFDQLRE